VLDAVLAAVSAVECTAEGAWFAYGHGMWPALGAVAGLLVGSTLLLRRRWPIAVVLVALAVTPIQMGFMLGAVALYTLAASKLPRRIIAALVAMTAAGTLIVSFVEMNGDLVRGGGRAPWITMVFALLVAVGLTAPPVLLGLYVGARRRLVETLRERADDLERELALLAEKAGERAERARIEERTRIAREMHDVVAHRVSLMVVHASALRAVLRSDPEKAECSAELLGEMGRQALGELRQMLGVLRTGDVVRAAAPVVPAQQTREPAPVAEGGRGPNLAQLGVLVEQSRAAGMVVTLSEEGDRRPLAAPVEQAAYRVVQEALTNAHKHAVGATTLVRVAYRAEEIAVLVENGPPDGEPSAGLPSGGNGLVGMKERVAALGGGFVAGPARGGGYRVSAVIPADPAG
jgi:signal transduction histidine kinase